MYLAGVIGSSGRRLVLAAGTALALIAGAAAANAAAPGTKTVKVLVTDAVSDQNPNAQSWGRVTSTPEGIDCPDDCSEDFPQGSSVELQLTRAPGYALARWDVFENASGPDCERGDVCSLTIDADDRVAQVEAALRPEAQLFATPEGAGTLAIDPVETGRPPDICAVALPLFDPLPNVCAPRYPNFTRVSVTALPDPAVPGARFVRWSDYHCGTTPTCRLSVRGERHLSAFFSPLYLTLAPGSFGAVAMPPPGGVCTFEPDPQTGNLTCEAAYPINTSVTLTRDPAAAQDPSHEWFGSCTGTGRTCTVRMRKNEYVRAGDDPTNDIPTRVGDSITLEYSGRKGGRIKLRPLTGSGPPASCPATCVRTGYRRGDQVLISVTGSAKAKFSRWGDGAGGRARSRSIYIGDRSPLKAIFVKK